MPRGLELDIGLAGLALLRNWLVGDAETADRLLAEVRSLAVDGHPRAAPFSVPEREVDDAYYEWAPDYDSPRNPVFPAEASAMLDLLREIPHGEALDAACGTGRQSLLLVGLGHTVIGVDRSPAMLEIARRELPGTDFREGLLQSLPVADDSVDLVVCSLALTHTENLLPPIREFARVLRPGGWIVLSDIHPMFIALSGQAAFRDREGNPSFVRNHRHWASSYFEAFQAASLKVERMVEACYEPEHVGLMIGKGGPLSDFAVHAAFDGLPAVLLWSVRKPS